MYSNSTSGCILNVETALNIEMTTFFQQTFGDNKTCYKIENKIFLLFTPKIAYYFIQCSLHCTKILCSTLRSRLSAVKCIISTEKKYKLFLNSLILSRSLMRSLLYFYEIVKIWKAVPTVFHGTLLWSHYTQTNILLEKSAVYCPAQPGVHQYGDRVASVIGFSVLCLSVCYIFSNSTVV